MCFKSDKKKYLQSLLRKIESVHSRTNSDIIMEFYEDHRGVCKDSGMFRKIQFMEVMLKMTSKDLDSLDKKDFVELIEKLEDKYSDQTTYTYIGIMKQFCKWYDNGRYWPFVEWKKRKRPKCSVKNSDLLTPEDIEKLVKACPNLMWKAYIEGFFHSRCRPNEFTSLKRKDVILEDHDIIITLNRSGKNEYSSREILIMENPGHFRKYVESVNNPNRHLFPQVSYTSYYNHIRVIRKKAGLKKKVWLYLFRHSKYTQDWERGIRTETRNALYGHAGTTKMNDYYLHLSNKSIRDDLDRVFNRSDGNSRKIVVVNPGFFGTNN